MDTNILNLRDSLSERKKEIETFVEENNCNTIIDLIDNFGFRNIISVLGLEYEKYRGNLFKLQASEVYLIQFSF